MSVSAFAVAVALALTFPGAPSITAPNAILVNVNSGEVLFEINADEPVSPTVAGAQGSQIFPEAGETVLLRDLMASIAVGSANDSCIAVAEHVAGTERAFVGIMNVRAAELGMGNTHFSTCTGLPKSGTISSARDIGKLAVALHGYTWIMECFLASEYSLRNGRIVLRNTNRLLSQYEGAYGFKTGYSFDAGFCIAAAADSAHRFTDADSA
jgi:D-alanyl-D-alanine carboxypeptidase (penicillin-binding protein 5/6)